MFSGTPFKVASWKDDSTYNKTFRIPTSGTGTTADKALEYMFNDVKTSIGNTTTYNATPVINITYYVSTS